MDRPVLQGEAWPIRPRGGPAQRTLWNRSPVARAGRQRPPRSRSATPRTGPARRSHIRRREHQVDDHLLAIEGHRLLSLRHHAMGHDPDRGAGPARLEHVHPAVRDGHVLPEGKLAEQRMEAWYRPEEGPVRRVTGEPPFDDVEDPNRPIGVDGERRWSGLGVRAFPGSDEQVSEVRRRGSKRNGRQKLPSRWRVGEVSQERHRLERGWASG